MWEGRYTPTVNGKRIARNIYADSEEECEVKLEALIKEMKELLGYMARHHEDLEKSFSDEQKETFEKFHDCWSEYMSLAEAAIFEYAFRLGAKLTMEIHKDEE